MKMNVMVLVQCAIAAGASGFCFHKPTPLAFGGAVFSVLLAMHLALKDAAGYVNKKE